ncbi:MAG: ATP-binding protein [Acidobacteriota bacterium]
MNKPFFLLAFVLLVSLCPHRSRAAAKDDAAAPRILLLNSYHSGYSWSDSETVGILAALKRRFPSSQLSIEYLDCKHFPDARHFERQKDLLLEKYGSSAFSAVIVMDNPALDFAVRYRSELFAHVPLIFCGINGYTSSMLGSQPDIGGIIEEFNVRATLQLMLDTHPFARHVVIIHDYTSTGLGALRDAQEAIRDIQKPVTFHIVRDREIGSLVDTLRRVEPGSLVLLLPYTRDRAGRVFDLNEIATLLSRNCLVPVYAVHQAQFGSGIAGGVLMDGKVHGEQAGAMAVRVLEGGTPDIRHESSFITGFDYEQMQRHNIPLSRVPSSAELINHPESFYTRNRELVINALAVFALLVSTVVLLTINIVKRRKAERALRESARMYKELIESIPDGVYKRNTEGKFIDVNRAMLTILGYESKGELMAVPIRQLFFSDDEYVSASREESLGRMMVFRMRKRDGSEVWIEDNASRHVDEGGTVLYHEGILRDITERVHSERQLRQAQKLEGIGTLAGGIAHDFNNLLAMILGSAELLKARSGGDEKLKKYADRIIEASERGASISRQLLIFSRPGQAELAPISISHIITGLQEMLQHFLPKTISIETVVRNTQGIIMGDEGQIHQALLNLAINAGDAMNHRGRLTIREFSVPPEAIASRFHQKADVPYAAVSVSDTGAGMDRATMEKIFEPFFSTKEQGKGTGLGLSIVHGIVKSHRGFIDVESTPGTGTTFTLYFPSVPSPPEATQKQGTGSSGATRQ